MTDVNFTATEWNIRRKKDWLDTWNDPLSSDFFSGCP